ncbi:MAG: polysaccharide deacetylase family protein [Niabella sp.]
MLNFRNTNIAFVVLLVSLIIGDLFFNVPWYGYALLLLLYTLALFYGSYFIHTQFYLKTYCRAETSEKLIAITFDDGPHPQNTPKILDVLKAHDAPVTFFCIGKEAAAHPQLLKRIHAEGHIIGNHSYTHGFWFDLQSAKKIEDDLQQMHDLVHQKTGVYLKWFRPPYGVTNPALRKAVQQMGYQVIGWSLRSMDTVTREEEELFQKLSGSLSPGAIVLLHDTQDVTVAVLSRFLKYVKERGYMVAPLDKLLNLQPYV